MPYLDRWEAAKTKFENATGVKKPKPKGFFNSFFNHTGLTTALKETDAVLDELPRTKPEDVPKLLKKGDEKIPKLTKAINDYVKVLEKDAKDEMADNNGKTDLYKHLKVLSTELKAINAHAINTLESTKITQQTNLSAKEQAAKMMKTGLASACAYAVAAVKKVQAEPTPDTFNKLFKTNDSPGRKVQVQLVNARNQLKEGKLKSLDIDPGFLAEKLTPWQSESSPNNVLPNTATKQDVLNRLEEFKGLLKLALHYSEQL
jgi:hypothetical protein